MTRTGLWACYDPQEFATPDAFRQDAFWAVLRIA